MSVSRLLRTLLAVWVCAPSPGAGAAPAGMPPLFRIEGQRIVMSARDVDEIDSLRRSREGLLPGESRLNKTDFSPQWAELSPEQRQQMREQIRQHWQSQPSEERERMRSEWQQRSPEDRQRIRQEMRERFERMSPEDRERLRERLREFNPGESGGPGGMRRRN